MSKKGHTSLVSKFIENVIKIWQNIFTSLLIPIFFLLVVKKDVFPNLWSSALSPVIFSGTDYTALPITNSSTSFHQKCSGKCHFAIFLVLLPLFWPFLLSLLCWLLFFYPWHSSGLCSWPFLLSTVTSLMILFSLTAFNSICMLSLPKFVSLAQVSFLNFRHISNCLIDTFLEYLIAQNEHMPQTGLPALPPPSYLMGALSFSCSIPQILRVILDTSLAYGPRLIHQEILWSPLSKYIRIRSLLHCY